MSKPKASPERLALPLVLSSVEAGFPSPADDYIEGELDLNELLVEHPSATFYVRVTGDSMVNAGILPEDILAVDRALNAKNNDIVIAVINGELTVKRLVKRRDGHIELHPDNDSYSIISFTDGSEFEVWGVVSGVIRKY
ncbi:MAG: peptidase S24 [Alphaproteobacteria bacterium]|nr:peptidase S24 [Alphaproteobacteria bacterium]MAS46167.1 peptidase S24 [Alphaproteobacteria bacterium]MAX95650.1 peptidase S24 [Alphaproteobacteria bacterium]MBN54214.1 peptidase S24 [Alphaproteobacteria bacterium]OUT42705.1 MAG: hypothetical protein CBB62_07945 [Micavibrio sp. TMED2]